MQWLALAGYLPITLDTLVNWRNDHRSLPSRPIIITFDDGFRDCADYAVPILQARGFIAVFYIVAGFAGMTSRWIVPERGVEFPLMDWTAARRLQAAGFQCGSHTMSHPRLTELSYLACRNELLQSRHLIEDRVGQEVRHLAYPFGCFDKNVRALAIDAGYLSACSVNTGLSAPNEDLLALHRIPVTGQDSLPDFICRLHTALSVAEVLYGKARAARQRLERP